MSYRDEIEYFECQCGADEHRLVFHYDAEEPELTLSVCLNIWEPWYKRLWAAVKHTFGYRPMFGHYDTFMLHPDDAKRLSDLCDRFIKERKARNEEF